MCRSAMEILERHSKLMTREWAEPTEAFEFMVKSQMVPVFQMILSLLGRTVNDKSDGSRLRLYALSLVAQGFYFQAARPLISRLLGRDYDEDLIGELVEHITDFSLNGLPVGDE